MRPFVEGFGVVVERQRGRRAVKLVRIARRCMMDLLGEL